MAREDDLQLLQPAERLQELEHKLKKARTKLCKREAELAAQQEANAQLAANTASIEAEVDKLLQAKEEAEQSLAASEATCTRLQQALSREQQAAQRARGELTQCRADLEAAGRAARAAQEAAARAAADAQAARHAMQRLEAEAQRQAEARAAAEGRLSGLGRRIQAGIEQQLDTCRHVITPKEGEGLDETMWSGLRGAVLMMVHMVVAQAQRTVRLGPTSDAAPPSAPGTAPLAHPDAPIRAAQQQSVADALAVGRALPRPLSARPRTPGVTSGEEGSQASGGARMLRAGLETDGSGNFLPWPAGWDGPSAKRAQHARQSHLVRPGLWDATPAHSHMSDSTLPEPCSGAVEGGPELDSSWGLGCALRQAGQGKTLEQAAGALADCTDRALPRGGGAAPPDTGPAKGLEVRPAGGHPPAQGCDGLHQRTASLPPAPAPAAVLPAAAQPSVHGAVVAGSGAPGILTSGPEGATGCATTRISPSTVGSKRPDAAGTAGAKRPREPAAAACVSKRRRLLDAMAEAAPDGEVPACLAAGPPPVATLPRGVKQRMGRPPKPKTGDELLAPVLRVEVKRNAYGAHAASIVRHTGKATAKALHNGSCPLASLVAAAVSGVLSCAAPVCDAAPDDAVAAQARVAGDTPAAVATAAGARKGSSSGASGGANGSKASSSCPPTAPSNRTQPVSASPASGPQVPTAGHTAAAPLAVLPGGWGGWCLPSKWSLAVASLLAHTANVVDGELQAIAATAGPGQCAAPCVLRCLMRELHAAALSPGRAARAAADPQPMGTSPEQALRDLLRPSLAGPASPGALAAMLLPLEVTERCALVHAFAVAARASDDRAAFRGLLQELLSEAPRPPMGRPPPLPPHLVPLLYAGLSVWPEALMAPGPQAGRGIPGSPACIWDPVGAALHAAVVSVAVCGDATPPCTAVGLSPLLAGPPVLPELGRHLSRSLLKLMAALPPVPGAPGADRGVAIGAAGGLQPRSDAAVGMWLQDAGDTPPASVCLPAVRLALRALRRLLASAAGAAAMSGGPGGDMLHALGTSLVLVARHLPHGLAARHVVLAVLQLADGGGLPTGALAPLLAVAAALCMEQLERVKNAMPCHAWDPPPSLPAAAVDTVAWLDVGAAVVKVVQQLEQASRAEFTADVAAVGALACALQLLQAFTSPAGEGARCAALAERRPTLLLVLRAWAASLDRAAARAHLPRIVEQALQQVLQQEQQPGPG